MHFCNSLFWDRNLTWSTQSPDLTPCFQKTLLIYLPCVFFLVFASLDLTFNISYGVKRKTSWNWVNLSKLRGKSILILLALIEAMNLGFLALPDSELVWADVVAVLVKGVTCVFRYSTLIYSSNIISYIKYHT